jgi:pimeloyl-ACP methyl ester carboxylesterase
VNARSNWRFLLTGAALFLNRSGRGGAPAAEALDVRHSPVRSALFSSCAPQSLMPSLNPPRKPVAVAICLAVGALHLFAGPHYRGPLRAFVAGYLIDLVLPFSLVLLLGVGLDRSPSLRLPRYCRTFFRAFFHSPQLSEQLELGSDEQWLAKFDVTSSRVWASIGEYDIHERLPRIQAPTLILHGTSSVISMQGAEAIAARIPRSRLVALEDVGHFPYMEAPLAFAVAVRVFLWPHPVCLRARRMAPRAANGGAVAEGRPRLHRRRVGRGRSPAFHWNRPSRGRRWTAAASLLTRVNS